MPATPLSLAMIESCIADLEFGSGPDSYLHHYARISASRLYDSLRFIEDELGDLDGRAVLDLGSYPHVFPALLRRIFDRATVHGNHLWTPSLPRAFLRRLLQKLGLPIPRPRLERTLVRRRDGGPPIGIDIHRFDIEKTAIPFSDATLDWVFLMEVLEHLRRDPMFVVAEANRVLKPGGRFFITTPNAVSWQHLHKALHHLPPCEAPSYTHGGRGNVMEYTPDQLRWLLEAGGFRVVKLETTDFLLDDHRPEVAAADEAKWTGQMQAKLTRVSPGRTLREIGVRTKTERLRERATVREWLRRLELSQADRGMGIFALAEKIGPVRARYPAGIYTAELWS